MIADDNSPWKAKTSNRQETSHEKQNALSGFYPPRVGFGHAVFSLAWMKTKAGIYKTKAIRMAPAIQRIEM